MERTNQTPTVRAERQSRGTVQLHLVKYHGATSEDGRLDIDGVQKQVREALQDMMKGARRQGENLPTHRMQTRNGRMPLLIDQGKPRQKQ